jgi:UDP-glucose 4-epimerase
MKILIVGCKGFIGEATDRYLSEKHEVYGCDVMPAYDKERYFIIDASNASFNFVFQRYKFDVCINCSGAASVPDSITDPARDYELNTHNVFKLLDSIRQFNPSCHFINLSSAAVYGNPEKLPINESHPLNPISPYGLHKMQAEILCQEFSSFFNIRTSSLRIFSAYGPGLRKQIFWDLYKKTLSSNNIQLLGNGTEARDYIYSEDIAKAIEVVMNCSGELYEQYNIANGVSYTIKEAVSIFFEKLNWNGTSEFTGVLRKGDPAVWQADISKIKQKGFIPNFDFKDGINNYIEWLKGQR